MYQKIHFLFQKATHKQTNTQKIKKQESKKLKETKEEKRISPEKSIKKNKSATARAKIFVVTRISGNMLFLTSYLRLFSTSTV